MTEENKSHPSMPLPEPPMTSGSGSGGHTMQYGSHYVDVGSDGGVTVEHVAEVNDETHDLGMIGPEDFEAIRQKFVEATIAATRIPERYLFQNNRGEMTGEWENSHRRELAELDASIARASEALGIYSSNPHSPQAREEIRSILGDEGVLEVSKRQCIGCTYMSYLDDLHCAVHPSGPEDDVCPDFECDEERSEGEQSNSDSPRGERFEPTEGSIARFNHGVRCPMPDTVGHFDMIRSHPSTDLPPRTPRERPNMVNFEDGPLGRPECTVRSTPYMILDDPAIMAILESTKDVPRPDTLLYHDKDGEPQIYGPGDELPKELQGEEYEAPQHDDLPRSIPWSSVVEEYDVQFLDEEGVS